MMNYDLEKLKNIKIEDIKSENGIRIFSDEDIELFRKEQGVVDLGQLLALTKGLSNSKIFQMLEEGEVKFETLKEFVLGCLLHEYRKWKDNKPPLGCIDPQNGEYYEN